MFGSWGSGYEELWKAIIRPPRDDYKVSDLGPTVFVISSNRMHVERKDFVLTNKRGQRIQCSHFQPVESDRVAENLPCVVYMHGNCSSRMEALSCLQVLLPYNITVFAFDFAGSGLSDGEYVSLGWWEREDLAEVVDYLRKPEARCSTIGLWGRSMGAVTALLHGDRDPSIAAMVLDSPFSSLRVLSEELVDTYAVRLPRWLVGVALSMLRSSIQSRAHFDIDKLVPLNHVDKTFIPAFFIAATGDNFILPHHTKDLHERYAGDKNLLIVDGDHNSVRPKNVPIAVSAFLIEALQLHPQGLVDAMGQGVRNSRSTSSGAVAGRRPSGRNLAPPDLPVRGASTAAYMSGSESEASPDLGPAHARQHGRPPHVPTDRPPRRNEMVPPERGFHWEAAGGGGEVGLVADFDEEAQLQMALQLSLQEGNKASSNLQPPAARTPQPSGDPSASPQAVADLAQTGSAFGRAASASQQSHHAHGQQPPSQTGSRRHSGSHASRRTLPTAPIGSVGAQSDRPLSLSPSPDPAVGRPVPAGVPNPGGRRLSGAGGGEELGVSGGSAGSIEIDAGLLERFQMEVALANAHTEGEEGGMTHPFARTNYSTAGEEVSPPAVVGQVHATANRQSNNGR